VKELKRISNAWLKERGRDYADFEWQGGYSDFSVSQSNLEQIKRYIANQETHHRKMTFQDELRELLRKHQQDWDERYVGLTPGNRIADFRTPTGFRPKAQGWSPRQPWISAPKSVNPTGLWPCLP